MLVGRPIIKALDMSINFARQKLKFGDDDWQDAILGRHKEYLLDLTSTFKAEHLSWESSFDLQFNSRRHQRQRIPTNCHHRFHHHPYSRRHPPRR